MCSLPELQVDGLCRGFSKASQWARKIERLLSWDKNAGPEFRCCNRLMRRSTDGAEGERPCQTNGSPQRRRRLKLSVIYSRKSHFTFSLLLTHSPISSYLEEVQLLSKNHQMKARVHFGSCFILVATLRTADHKRNSWRHLCIQISTTVKETLAESWKSPLGGQGSVFVFWDAANW